MEKTRKSKKTKKTKKTKNPYEQEVLRELRCLLGDSVRSDKIRLLSPNSKEITAENGVYLPTLHVVVHYVIDD